MIHYIITDLFYIASAIVSLAVAWFNYCENVRSSQTTRVLLTYMIDQGFRMPTDEEVEEISRKLGFEK